jgi:porin
MKTGFDFLLIASCSILLSAPNQVRAESNDSGGNLADILAAASKGAPSEKPEENVHKSRKSHKMKATVVDSENGVREPANAAPVAPKIVEEELTNGFHVEGLYLGEESRVFSGGLKRESNYAGLAILRVSIDMEKTVGLRGLTFFSQIQIQHGANPSEAVGDIQGTSNLESPVDTGKIYEAWLMKSFAEGKSSILFGVYDLNSEFYANAPAGLFLNSSFGIGKEISQTGEKGPSIYPSPTLALRFKTEVNDSFYLQTAVADATAGSPTEAYGTQVSYRPEDGTILISEFGWTERESGNVTSKLGIGVWGYSKTFDDLSKTDSSGAPVPGTSTGLYIVGERQITSHLSGFLRYGEASESVNRIKNNFATGLTYSGLIPSRAEDQIGIAATTVTNGSNYTRSASQPGLVPSETTYELTYNAILSKSVSVQPDLQYVKNPGTVTTTDDAVVGALRFKIGF